MSKVVIKAEDISKQYRLGLVGTGTVKDDMKRWWYNLRGKEDPFLKIGETNDRAVKGESDYVWSLGDINFEINQGDSVGIIGRNGAGKSTLLKILSQVTQPTTGKIYTKGRIASLLEVGTGFHPEMTGRENIYLNGAILGMRKHEITRKLDEIIAFSGVERYIDTPVKRYSSGMYVRLAFAVAAHLESEILIVDEVLAVGDAEFQKKCLGKMNDVSKGEGRTVLFVSHNMAAVQKLCSSSILLQNGKIIDKGKTDNILNFYLNQSVVYDSEYLLNVETFNYKIAYATKVAIEDICGNLMREVPLGKSWRVKIDFEVNESVRGLVVALGISDMNGVSIMTSWSKPQNFEHGNYSVYFIEEAISLNPGKYKLHIGLSKGSQVFDYIDEDVFLVMSEIIFEQDESVISNRNGIIANQMKIKIEKI